METKNLKKLKTIIKDIIEESYSEIMEESATVEESDEQKIDKLTDEELLVLLQDEYIETVELIGSEEDFTFMSEDYDEYSGSSWETTEFDEYKLLDEAMDRFSEDVYDTLNLDDEEDYDTIVRIEEFIENNGDKLMSSDKLTKVMKYIESDQLGNASERASYNKDAYSHYGVNRSDF
jgi:hypothetical protein